MDIKTWRSDMVTIKVDYDKCKGHGDCVDACPSEVYELDDGKADDTPYSALSRVRSSSRRLIPRLFRGASPFPP